MEKAKEYKKWINWLAYHFFIVIFITLKNLLFTELPDFQVAVTPVQLHYLLSIWIAHQSFLFIVFVDVWNYNFRCVQQVVRQQESNNHNPIGFEQFRENTRKFTTQHPKLSDIIITEADIHNNNGDSTRDRNYKLVWNNKCKHFSHNFTVRSLVYVRYVEGHHRHFKMTLKNSERRFWKMTCWIFLC